ILLIKRASTDYSPDLWEPPGGSVDAEDESILHAVVREVWEETGLRVESFGTGNIMKDNAGEQYHAAGKEGKIFVEVTFHGSGGEKWCELNLAVEPKMFMTLLLRLMQRSIKTGVGLTRRLSGTFRS
ncbi:hypothetical protein BJ878DRAFT_420486, partial [Calycina marina]